MSFQYAAVSPLESYFLWSEVVFWDEVSMDDWNIDFISLIHSSTDKFPVLHN